MAKDNEQRAPATAFEDLRNGEHASERDQVIAAVDEFLGEKLDDVAAVFMVVCRRDRVARLKIAGDIHGVAQGEVLKAAQALQLLALFPGVISPPAVARVGKH